MLIGLLLSLIIPLIIIPVYVEYVSVPETFLVLEQQITTTPTYVEPTFDFSTLLPWIYFIGVTFFIGKLGLEVLSLHKLIKRYPFHQTHSYIYVVTTNHAAPFSFFKYIVYNPDQFSEQELALILKHERIHSKQGHSIDIVFAQLICALLWFNPIIWLYKKAMQQNLEFIADEATQTNLNCEKTYQNLLLKTSIGNHDLSIINTFYNSLIKKRIFMLHTSKSKKISAYKYALVVPILMLFVFNFNTEIVAQISESPTQQTKTAQNVLKYVISKNTKDNQLESIKNSLAKNDVMVTFENLMRNERKEITGIKIIYESKISKGQHFVSSENPIGDIEIALNVNENNLMVGGVENKLSQSFDILEKDGETKLKEEENEKNVVLRLKDDNSNTDVVAVVGKDGQSHEVKSEKKIYMVKSDATKDSNQNEDALYIKKNKSDTIWIKKDVKNIVWTTEDGEEVKIITVEKGDDNFKISSNDNENPLIIFDGKEITKMELEVIAPENIENVDVLKGKKAIEKYGKKAKDGAIIITSKKELVSNGKKDQAVIVGEVSNVITQSDSGKKSISYSISKITSDNELAGFKASLKKESVDVEFLKINRNKNREITTIEIALKNTQGKQTTATYENNDGIGKIRFGIQKGELFVVSEK